MKKALFILIILFFSCSGRKNETIETTPPPAIKKEKGHEYYYDFDLFNIRGVDKIEHDLSYPYVDIEKKENTLIVKAVKEKETMEYIYEEHEGYYYRLEANYGTEGCSIGHHYYKDGVEYTWEYYYDGLSDDPADTCWLGFRYADKDIERGLTIDIINHCDKNMKLFKPGPYIPDLDSSFIIDINSLEYRVNNNIFTWKVITQYTGLKPKGFTECYAWYSPYHKWYYIFSNPWGVKLDCNSLKPLKH